MKKENKIIDDIRLDVLPKLPITVHYITTQSKARNELDKKKIIKKTAKINIEFYNTTGYQPYGYHKPISKIINFVDE